MSDGGTVAVGDVGRVLVLGETDRAETAGSILESAFGSSLVAVRSPTAGLARLDRDAVDCVVCEFRSAERSIVTAIRDRDRDVPVVAIVDGSEASAALEAGADDVVRSDDPDDAVVGRVRNAIERSRLRRERGDAEPYRSILAHSDALVLVVDGSGEISYASPPVEARTGYTPDDLERTGLERLVHPDDREDAIETLAEVTDDPLGSTRRLTARLRHADGTWHRYELAATNRLEDPTVDGVVLTVADRIAEPKAGAERTIPASAVDRLADAFFTLASDWTIRYANEAASGLLDRDRRALPGTVVWELLPESAKGEFYERFEEAKRTGSPVEFVQEYPPLSGPLEVRVHPSADGLSVYAREAPDEEAIAEDRLKRLETIESALDSIDDGVFVLEGDRIVHANAPAFDLAGREVLVGDDVASVFGDDVAAEIDSRASSPIVRRSEPIEAALDGDGTPTPVAVSVAPLPVDGRVACVVRDASDREATDRAVRAIARAIDDALAAETRPEVRRAAVDAARSAFECDLVCCYLAVDGTLEPTAYAVGEAGVTVDLPVLDANETIVGDAIGREGAVLYEAADLQRFRERTGIRATRAVAAPIDEDGVLLATSVDPERFTRRSLVVADAIAEAATGGFRVLDRESRIAERERALSRKRGRLDRLEAYLDARRTIDRAIVRARTREEIERAVVDALSELEDVAFVWIGEAEAASARVTPRARAGDDDGYLESVSVPLSAEAGEPTGRAIATGERAAVETIEAGDGEWRREAATRGFRSIVSLPLAYDDYAYGALSIYGTRPSAFDEPARSVLTEIAEALARAMNAVETKRALLTDGVIELAFLLREDRDVLSSLAQRLDAEIELQSIVPEREGRSIVFFRAIGVEPEAVEDALAEFDAVGRVRLVRERDDGPEFEVELSGSTIATAIVEHGGVLRSIAAGDEATRLTVDVERGADVRSFVEMLDRKYPGVELVARRERDRSAGSPRPFRAELRERLTDRQRRAIETAYYRGFFEWPRASTGEEVAEALGVSQPTFNRHFRSAERKLFELLFEEG